MENLSLSKGVWETLMEMKRFKNFKNYYIILFLLDFEVVRF